MRSVSRIVHAVIRDRKAATAVEYGLILALVFLAMLVGAQSMGSASTTLWGNVSTKVKSSS